MGAGAPVADHRPAVARSGDRHALHEAEGGQENAMRALLLGLIVASGLGLAAHPSQAAIPAGAMAIGQTSEAGAFAEPVDCRRYPHRHRKAKPHGLGFGCPKKARPAR
jgi:hypothetical protein